MSENESTITGVENSFTNTVNLTIMTLRRFLKIAGFSSLFYVLAYVLLSATGGYEPGKTGQFTRFRLPTHDVWVWQLRFGRDSTYHHYSTLLPSLFRPLLFVDRMTWHKPLPLLQKNANGEIVDCAPPPRYLLHPRVIRAEQIIDECSKRREKARLSGDSKASKAAMDEMYKKLDAL